MIKQFFAFETKEGEHEVKILISSACPLGLVHDSLFKARNYVVEKINESVKQDAPQSPQEPTQE